MANGLRPHGAESRLLGSTLPAASPLASNLGVDSRPLMSTLALHVGAMLGSKHLNDDRMVKHDCPPVSPPGSAG